MRDVARTKALVLTAFVSVMVVPSLMVVAWMHPGDAWKVALIALLWFPAALMAALKAVTVFPSFSSSGEPQPMQASRNMAAAIGNMVFAVGVFTANWSVVFAGLLLNGVFAAALWVRLETQLAYLFDADAEPDEVPPTMVNALVAIVAHLEIVSVFAAVLAAISGTGIAGIPLLLASTCSGLLVASIA